MNNEYNSQNNISVNMNGIKIKYEDLVLSDSDSEIDKEIDKESKNNLINNSVIKNIRNKQSINKKSNIKIFRITKFLKKIYNKVNNINKKTLTPMYLLKENKHTNIFVKNSINFLETNYIKIVNNQIDFNKKNNNPKYNFENVYVISFSFNKNYRKIIEIYKKILLDLNDDYKLLFLNPIFDFDFDFDFDVDIGDNLDLQTIIFFKNKVNYKKRILDEYFKQRINYYKYINIITWIIYNFIGCIGILLLSIKLQKY